ncbi:uncharacterized protein LOC132194708 [Neocloeon triangulifer]|uniref:uncharacterized protein LOC132194708 n=1 Tax=Neocloeon triangulifer TaxID=2078957 RepID=UPI00286EEF79|nr:uncharacterized protein LOC132194708 [Neocloeon triangulifer]
MDSPCSRPAKSIYDVNYLIIASGEIPSLKVLVQGHGDVQKEGSKKTTLPPVPDILSSTKPPKISVPRSASADLKRLSELMRDTMKRIMAKAGQISFKGQTTKRDHRARPLSLTENHPPKIQKLSKLDIMPKGNVNFVMDPEAGSKVLESNDITKHPGFTNPNVICYVISSIQLLNSSNLFQSLFAQMVFPKGAHISEEIQSLCKIAKQVAGKEKIKQFELDKGIKDLAKLTLEFGMGAGQQDPIEYLTFLLPNLTRQLNQTGCFEDAASPFLMSTTSLCHKCKKQFGKPQPSLFHFITPQCNKTVQELIDLSLSEDRLCCSEERTVHTEFLMLPISLMVQIGRTQFGNTLRDKKPIEISPEIVLNRRETRMKDPDSDQSTHDGISSKTQNTNSKQLYRLKGLVLHEGLLSTSGHYLSFVFSNFEEKWINCDDHRVRTMPNFFERELQDVATKTNAYLLHYEAVVTSD